MEYRVRRLSSTVGLLMEEAKSVLIGFTLVLDLEVELELANM